MFLAEWRPFSQKNRTALEREAAFETLQQDYGLQFVTDGKTKAETLMLPVWLTFQSEAVSEQALAAAEALGFKPQTRLKTICTGLIPVARVEALAAVAGLRQLQVGQRAQACMDLTRKAIRLDALQDDHVLDLPEWPSLRGEGVIIGIVDGGIEYEHPNFRDPDDKETLRIRRVWSQGESNGAPPDGYDYGVELSTPERILSAGFSKDNETHGTHVGGIAAGSGAGTVYRGVAPKADLVMVPTTLMTNHILDGIQYIRSYAGQERKPCVVNLSIGSQIGPHDGTSAFDRALDEMKAPGFIVVGAAGNDGDLPLHIGYDFNPAAGDTVFHTQVQITPSYRYGYIDIWSHDSSSFAVSLSLVDSETGRIAARTAYYSARSEESLEDEPMDFGDYGQGYLTASSEWDAINGKRRILLMIDVRDLYATPEEYTLGLSVKSEEATASGLNMWSTQGTFADLAHDSLQPAVAGTTDYTVSE
ncbi:MAG: S8 family serine peptidase, partial [Bacteroidales bacterium]|nr:S8 family serine peptidase [Bacteroidales bacterium]